MSRHTARLFMRAGGMGAMGAGAMALGGWWAVAVLLGAWLWLQVWRWEVEELLLERQQTEVTWDGRAWRHQDQRHRRGR